MTMKNTYYGDSLMDGELFDTMSVLNLMSIRKAFIAFKTGS